MLQRRADSGTDLPPPRAHRSEMYSRKCDFQYEYKLYFTVPVSCLDTAPANPPRAPGLLSHSTCLVLETAPVTVPVSCVDSAYRYIPYSRRCCRGVLIRGRTSRLPGHKEARCIRGSMIFSTNTNFTSQYRSRAWTQHQQTPLEHRVCLVTVPVSCLDTPPVVCLVTVSVSCLDTIPVTVPVSCVDTAYRYIPYSRRCCRGVLIRGRTSGLPGHKEARYICGSVIFSTKTNLTSFEFLS